jgi:hypothetical protein
MKQSATAKSLIDEYYTRKHCAGAGGALLLAIGVFSPFVRVPLAGAYTFFEVGRIEGGLMILVAIITANLVILHHFKSLWFTGAASAAVLVSTFVRLLLGISDLKQRCLGRLGDTFLGDILTRSVRRSVELQWGVTILLVGAALVFAAALLDRKPDAIK